MQPTRQQDMMYQISSSGPVSSQPKPTHSVPDKVGTPSAQPQDHPPEATGAVQPQLPIGKEPRRIPRLRAVVESEAFKNVLVDEVDMMHSRAATLIQANWRGYQLRQKLASQMMTAKAIQEAWRRFNTKLLGRPSKTGEKTASLEDEANIPYHPPQQVHFQRHEGEDLPSQSLPPPLTESKETQFPSADRLIPGTSEENFQRGPAALGSAELSIEGTCTIGAPGVTFLPCQTMAMSLPCPVRLEAKCQPCLLTKTVRSSCLVRVEEDTVAKTRQTTPRVSKARVPGPAPPGRSAQALDGPLKGQTQVPVEAERPRAQAQVCPVASMTRTQGQVCPVASLTKTQARVFPVTKTQAQVCPVASMTRTQGQACTVASLTKTQARVFPVASTRTQAQVCPVTSLTKTQAQVCPVTSTKTQAQVFPVTKTQAQVCPVASTKTQAQAFSVTKTQAPVCPVASVTKTQARVFPVVSTKTKAQVCPVTSTKTQAQVCLVTSMTKARMVTMMAKTPAPTHPAALMSRTPAPKYTVPMLSKPPPQACSAATTTKAPPQTRPVAAPTKTQAQVSPAATTAQTPFQTCPPAMTTRAAPQTRLVAMVTKTPAQLRSVATIFKTLCLSPPSAGGLKCPLQVTTAAGTPKSSPPKHLRAPKGARAMGGGEGKARCPRQPHLEPGAPRALAEPHLKAGRSKTPQKQVKTEISRTTADTGASRASSCVKLGAEQEHRLQTQRRLETGIVKVQSQVYLPVDACVTPNQVQPVPGVMWVPGQPQPAPRVTRASSQAQLTTEATKPLLPARQAADLSKTQSQPHLAGCKATIQASRHPSALPRAKVEDRLTQVPPHSHGPGETTQGPHPAPLGAQGLPVPLLTPSAHPPCNVESWGDSVAAQAQPPTHGQNALCQEEVTAFQLASLCTELAAMLGSQDWHPLLAEALSHGDVRAALTRALAKEAPGAARAKLLPPGMLGTALVKALSWGDLGLTPSRALSRGELRAELARAVQGKLADVLSKALTDEERATLRQALSQVVLRSGTVLPKAAAKAAGSGITAVPALLEVDCEGRQLASWGPGLGLVRPHSFKVRVPKDGFWEGFSSGQLAGPLEALGVGAVLEGSPCRTRPSGGAPAAAWAVPTAHQCPLMLELSPIPSRRREPWGVSSGPSLASMVSQEDVSPSPCPGTGGSASTSPSVARDPALSLPEPPLPQPHPCPWQLLVANGAGPSTSRPAISGGTAPSSPKPHAVSRVAPRPRTASGEGRGVAGGRARVSGGRGQGAHPPHPSTICSRTACWCQVARTTQGSLGGCHPSVARGPHRIPVVPQESPRRTQDSPDSRQGSTVLRERVSKRCPGVLKASVGGKEPQRAVAPGQRWAFGRESFVVTEVGRSILRATRALAAMSRQERSHTWISLSTKPCAQQVSDHTVAKLGGLAARLPQGADDGLAGGLSQGSVACSLDESDSQSSLKSVSTLSPSTLSVAAGGLVDTWDSSLDRELQMEPLLPGDPQEPEAMGKAPEDGCAVPSLQQPAPILHQGVVSSRVTLSAHRGSPNRKVTSACSSTSTPELEGLPRAPLRPGLVRSSSLGALIPSGQQPPSLAQQPVASRVAVPSLSHPSVPSTLALSLSQPCLTCAVTPSLSQPGKPSAATSSLSHPLMDSGMAPSPGQPPMASRVGPSPAHLSVASRVASSLAHPSVASGVAPSLSHPSVAKRMAPSIAHPSVASGVTLSPAHPSVAPSQAQPSVATGMVPRLAQPSHVSMTSGIVPSLAHPSMTSVVVPSQAQPLVTSGVAPSPAQPSHLSMTSGVVPRLAHPSMTSVVIPSLAQPLVTSGVAPRLAHPSVTNVMVPSQALPLVTSGVAPRLAQPSHPSMTSGVAPRLAHPSMTSGVVPRLAQPLVTNGVAPRLAQPSHLSVTSGVVPRLAHPSMTNGVAPSRAQPSVASSVAPSPAQPSHLSMTNGVVPSLAHPSMTSVVVPSLTQPLVTSGVAPRLAHPSMTNVMVPSQALPLVTSGVAPRLVQPSHPSMTSGVAPRLAHPSVASGVGHGLDHSSLAPRMDPNLQFSRVNAVAPSLHHPSAVFAVPLDRLYPSGEGSLGQALSKPSVDTRLGPGQEPLLMGGVGSEFSRGPLGLHQPPGVSGQHRGLSPLSGVTLSAPNLYQASVGASSPGQETCLPQGLLVRGVTDSASWAAVAADVPPSLPLAALAAGVGLSHPPLAGGVGSPASQISLAGSPLTQASVGTGPGTSYSRGSLSSVGPSVSQTRVDPPIALDFQHPSVATIVTPSYQQASIIPQDARTGPPGGFEPGAMACGVDLGPMAASAGKLASLPSGCVMNGVAPNVPPGSLATLKVSTARALSQGRALESAVGGSFPGIAAGGMAQPLPRGAMLMGVIPRPYQGALAGEQAPPFQSPHAPSLALAHSQALEAGVLAWELPQASMVLGRAAQLAEEPDMALLGPIDDQAALKPAGWEEARPLGPNSSHLANPSVVLVVTPWLQHDPAGAGADYGPQSLEEGPLAGPQVALLGDVAPVPLQAPSLGSHPAPHGVPVVQPRPVLGKATRDPTFLHQGSVPYVEPQSHSQGTLALAAVLRHPQLSHGSPVAPYLHPSLPQSLGAPGTASHVPPHSPTASGTVDGGFQMDTIASVLQRPVAGAPAQGRYKALGPQKSYRSMQGHLVPEMPEGSGHTLVPPKQPPLVQSGPEHPEGAQPLGVAPGGYSREAVHGPPIPRLAPGVCRLSPGYGSSPSIFLWPLLDQASRPGSLVSTHGVAAPVGDHQPPLTPAMPAVASVPTVPAIVGGMWGPAGLWGAVGDTVPAADPTGSGALLASMQVVEEVIVRAVVTIQAHARGYLVRRTIRIWHRSATVIQAAWRGFHARRCITQLQGATVAVQAVGHRYCTPRWRPAALPPPPASSGHRCFQSCQPQVCGLCRSLSTGLGGTPSVVLLVGASPRACHSCGHSWPTRVLQGTGRAPPPGPRRPPPLPPRHRAAIAIQAAWRGFRTRQRLQQEQAAARTVQANWRGHYTRSCLTTDALLGPRAACDGPRHGQRPGT